MNKADYSGIDPETGERWSARKVAKLLGLRAIHDEDTIRQVCEKVVGLHPKQVEAYRKGKVNILGFFIKEVMAETKSGADPVITDRVLKELLAAPCDENELPGLIILGHVPSTAETPKT